MKKHLLTLFIAILAISAHSQNIRLNAYSGYVFDDRVDSYYSNTNYFNGTVKGGYQWGLGAEFMLHQGYGLELQYLRQDTKAPMTYYSGGVKSKDFDLAINNIFLAGTHYFRTANSKIEPYAGLFIGLSIFNIKNPDTNGPSSATKFGYGGRGGVNIWLTENVGIKLQAQLISASQAFGGGFYFGSGGSGVGVSSYSSFYQFGLGAGLSFKLDATAKTTRSVHQ